MRANGACKHRLDFNCENRMTKPTLANIGCPIVRLYGNGHHFAVQADLGRTNVAPSGANNDVEHRFARCYQVRL